MTVPARGVPLARAQLGRLVRAQPGRLARARPGRRAGALLGRLAAAVLVAALALPLLRAATPASAQTTSGGSAPDQLRLRSQTPWVSNGDTFQLGLSVDATASADDQMQLTIYGALSSRSDFTASLAGHLYTPRLATFNPVTVAAEGANPSFSIVVNHRTSGATPSVFLSVSGVYPVTVDLFDPNNHLLSQLVTYLVYSGPETASNSKLDVAWVAPFTAPPASGGSGGATNGVSAKQQAGLGALAQALVSHPRVATTVEATPQTVEALATGTASERTVATQLGQAVTAGVASEQVELMAAPYVRLDLPAMLAAGLDPEISAQLDTGKQTLSSTLHTVAQAATWINAGPMSAQAVDDLAGRGVRQIVVGADQLSGLAASDSVRTLAQPFSLAGRASRVAAAAADQGLGSHFNGQTDQVLAAHQLLAELAMVHFELPNRRGGRGVVVVPPPGWTPDAAFLGDFLDGLGTAPILSPVTVDGLFSGVTPLQHGGNTVVRSLVPAQQPKGSPITDAPAIRAARRPILSLSAVVPSGTSAITQIERHILVSESADLSDKARLATLGAATAQINHLKSMVRLPGNQSITFTARQGRIPITVLSSAPYPLKVQLRMSSEKLGFEPASVPGGRCTATATSELCSVMLNAQDTTVRIPVVARTAGVFSLTVALDSPDGQLNLATNQDTVRSTAASGVGVIISVGAALLLAMWWLRDVRHSRRARRLMPRELRAPDLPIGAGEAAGGFGGYPGPAGAGGAGRRLAPAGGGAAPAGGRAPAGGPVEPAAGGVRAEPEPAGRVSAPTRPGPAAGDPELAAYGLDVNVPPGTPLSGPQAPDEPGQATMPMYQWDAWGGWDDPSGLITQPIPVVRPGMDDPSRRPARGPSEGAAEPGAPAVGQTSRAKLAERGPVPVAPAPPADLAEHRARRQAAAAAAASAATGRIPGAGGGGRAKTKAAGRDEGSFSRNTAVMAGGTLLSRVTGFGRVLALIWAFGISSGLTDVYNVANTVPNIIYDLVLGGILSATLVPVFVDCLNRENPEEGNHAISAVVTAITATMFAVSVLFWLLVPTIIRFYFVLNKTSGAASERALGVSLLHMFVPQLFLLGGIAVSTALLNARRRFAAAAFSPVINNVVAIGAIVAARVLATSITLPGFRSDQSALLILGLGTTAGYLFQLITQVPAMVRAGFRLRPVWDLGHPAVRTVLRLSLWTFGSVVANQISFNLILVLADHKKGDVTVFNTAYQFFQLPYAIFAVSIASVITTELAEHWTRGDLAGFRREMGAGMRLTLAVLMPAAVGYVVLAQPFLHLVLSHGSLSSGDAHRIAGVVVLFALGLPGFSAYLLLMRGYQAMQDTRSMFWLYLCENALTLALAGALYPIMGVGGLALGWVGAYSLGAIAAFADLRRRSGGLEGAAIGRGMLRIAVATALMVLPVLAIGHLLADSSELAKVGQVAGGVVAGAVVYLAAAHAFGVTELTTLLQRKSFAKGGRR